jgi:hypothetical protein
MNLKQKTKKHLELMHFGSFLAYLIEMTAFLRIITTTSCNLLMAMGKCKK